MQRGWFVFEIFFLYGFLGSFSGFQLMGFCYLMIHFYKVGYFS